MSKQSQRISKIRRKYGASAFQKWGRRGGSPVLASLVTHKPVKGYIARRVN